jgi:hypothetical protein
MELCLKETPWPLDQYAEMVVKFKEHLRNVTPCSLVDGENVSEEPAASFLVENDMARFSALSYIRQRISICLLNNEVGFIS